MEKLIDILSRSNDGRLGDVLARKELAQWIQETDESDFDEFVATVLEAYLQYQRERG